MTTDRLRRNAKASYVAFSMARYGARRPLKGPGPLVIYAHELDGCPRRSMARRATHIEELRSMTIQPWSHNLDRGDSFEQGRGLVHGVPAGVTMIHTLDDEDMAAIEGVLEARLGKGLAEEIAARMWDKGVILSGTPDFMALKGHELRIMDAKSPRKVRKDENGNYDMKPTRESRMRTYTRMARRVLVGHDGNALAAKLREVTPWPIRPGRLAPEGAVEDVHGVIVLDAGETYEFLELTPMDELEEDRAMYEKLAKALTAARLLTVGHPNGFLGMGLLSDEALKRLTGVDDEERSWQCGYCPLAAECPMSNVKVVKLEAGTSWERRVSKRGMEYRIAKDYELMTTDEELVKTSQRHDVRVRVKNGWVKSRSVIAPVNGITTIGDIDLDEVFKRHD